jgi:hypothetical protein
MKLLGPELAKTCEIPLTESQMVPGPVATAVARFNHTQKRHDRLRADVQLYALGVDVMRYTFLIRLD